MEFQPPGRDLIRTLQRGARFSRPAIPTWFQERFGRVLITTVDVLIALFPRLIPRLNDAALSSLLRECYIDRSFNVYNIGPGTNSIPALACTIFVPIAGDAYLAALDTVLKTAKAFAARGMHNTAPTSMRFVKGVEGDAGHRGGLVRVRVHLYGYDGARAGGCGRVRCRAKGRHVDLLRRVPRGSRGGRGEEGGRGGGVNTGSGSTGAR